MKSLESIIVCVFTLNSTLIGYGQQESIENLKKSALKASDTTQINLFRQLGEAYVYINSDSAIKYSSLSHDLRIKLNNEKGLKWPLFWWGVAEFQVGNYVTARELIEESIAYGEKNNMKNPQLWAAIYSYYGQVLMNQGEYNEAIKMLERSSAYSDTYNDLSGNSIQTSHLVNVYRSLGDYNKAFFFSQETIRLTRLLNDTIRMIICANLITGDLYKDAGDFINANRYFKETIIQSEKLNIPADAYLMLGRSYNQMKKYDSALYCFNVMNHFRKENPDPSIGKFQLKVDSIDICEAFTGIGNYDLPENILSRLLKYFSGVNAKPLEAKILLNLAIINKQKNKFSTALSMIHQVLQIAENSNAKPLLRDSYKLFSEIYDLLGKTDSSYIYFKSYIDLENAIINDQYKRSLALKDLKDNENYNKAKIDFLKSEKRKQLYLFLALILIGILLAILFFRSILLKRKKEQLHTLMKEANILLENKRKEQEVLQLQQKTTLLEMQALRAQMNPHFIFNSLNSINRFILQNEKASASAYLTKFSRLIRMILQNSNLQLISLEAEIEALMLYLDLESLRFENHFIYSLTMDKEIDSEMIKVPPLIIQPFVENAIWHGLMHKEERGRLELKLNLSEEFLFCTILDDGIGRKKSEEIKNKSKGEYRSMGQELTASRISLMSKMDLRDIISINDLVLENGEPGGTEVIIKIPLVYV